MQMLCMSVTSRINSVSTTMGTLTSNPACDLTKPEMPSKGILRSFVIQPKDHHVITACRQKNVGEGASGSFGPGHWHVWEPSTILFILKIIISKLKSGNSLDLKC
jgi:hypothetical protein